MKNYDKIAPIQSPIFADRQGAKRHYGVHPYFTRRPYNVVRQYVLHFSKEGDRVLDPFGGSGVTPIEAFLENRIGLQNDINPLANFIAQGIVNLHKGGLTDYLSALKTLRQMCQQELHELCHAPERDVTVAMANMKLPPNIELPRTSDVRQYHELFSPRQLAALAILRHAIDGLQDEHARSAMLLAWSAALAKLNRTFLSAHGRAESRGGSSIFSIYRYKIAKEPVELPPWKIFQERAENIIAAKAEIDRTIELKRRTNGWFGRFEIYDLDVDDLGRRFRGKIDYIFTDPPYGGHISYLDLSTLWNHWLGIMPSQTIRERELIVGGEVGVSEGAYTERLGKSIKSCIDMLKQGRWLSVVFQHWNPAYFDAILTSAAEAGADLRAAVPQVGNTVWSMHKKKGNESVLAGEMILTFCKSGKPKHIRSEPNGLDIRSAMSEILLNVNSRMIYGEILFNQLILTAWRKGAIGSLHITKDDFNHLMKREGWQYDTRKHYWVRDHADRPLFHSTP